LVVVIIVVFIDVFMVVKVFDVSVGDVMGARGVVCILLLKNFFLKFLKNF